MKIILKENQEMILESYVNLIPAGQISWETYDKDLKEYENDKKIKDFQKVKRKPKKDLKMKDKSPRSCETTTKSQKNWRKKAKFQRNLL